MSIPFVRIGAIPGSQRSSIEAMRYRCLIVDHDDTAVDSTAVMHYPAHREAMRILRPGRRVVTLQQWFLKNFNPGIMGYLTEELGFNDQELEREYQIWRSFTEARIPRFYPGFIETLIDFRERGGKIAVVSHSEEEIIRRDYGSRNFSPDLIFGWTTDHSRRKPDPWPVYQVLKILDMEPADAVVIDDLKPGVTMAKRAGISIAAAGWSHRIPLIERYMRRHCMVYLETIDELRELLFDANQGGTI